MTKTYEELEVDLHFLEQELKKAKQQCVELTNQLDDLHNRACKTCTQFHNPCFFDVTNPVANGISFCCFLCWFGLAAIIYFLLTVRI